MFCSNCGAQSTGKFCSNCGVDQQAESVKVPSSQIHKGTTDNKKLFDYYQSVLQKYAIFEGRTNRKEFWMFFLANVIISFCVGVLDGILGLGFLSTFYVIAVTLPNLSVAIRRCHDVGKSGWYCMIPIYNIVVFATESDCGRNAYGDPT